MIRQHTTQPAFTGGEMTSYLLGRHDIERFLLGGERVENFMACGQGPLVRRRGTVMVAENTCATGKLINFEYSRSQSRMLLLGCDAVVVGVDEVED